MLQQFPLWVHVMITIESGYSKTNITKKVNATYSHVSKIFFMLQDYGFVTALKKGRVTIVQLTEKGLQLQITLRRVCELLPGEMLQHTINTHAIKPVIVEVK